MAKRNVNTEETPIEVTEDQPVEKSVAPKQPKKTAAKKKKFEPAKEAPAKPLTVAQLSRQADKLEIQAAKLRSAAQQREARELKSGLQAEVKDSERTIKALERDLAAAKKAHDRASIKLGKLLDKLAVGKE